MTAFGCPFMGLRPNTNATAVVVTFRSRSYLNRLWVVPGLHAGSNSEETPFSVQVRTDAILRWKSVS
jgi:hypothetical protein